MVTEAAIKNQNGQFKQVNQNLGIFLVSVLVLFFEMLLIRWIGTEVRIFAYLQNSILVVCFLGLGIGCFTSRQPVVLRRMLVPLFILVLLMAIPLTRIALGSISRMLSVLDDLVIWGAWVSQNPLKTTLSVCFGLGITFVLMLFLLEMFIPLGRILGHFMDEHPRIIQAYSINVIGSLIGIWLFVLLSFL